MHIGYREVWKFTKKSDNLKIYIPFRFIFDAKVGGEIKTKVLVFRAILAGVNDTFTGQWNPTQYIGRPDKTYTYTGGERKIGMSIFRPNKFVDRSGSPTLFKILGTKSQSPNASVFLFKVTSSSAPPSI